MIVDNGDDTCTFTGTLSDGQVFYAEVVIVFTKGDLCSDLSGPMTDSDFTDDGCDWTGATFELIGPY